MSNGCGVVAGGSNILLKSVSRLEIPCRLRRFATGLPRLVWSTLILASLRLSGLIEIAGNGSVFASINLDKPFLDEPETSRCIEWRVGF